MTALERLKAIQPVMIGGEPYWPRREVLLALRLTDKRAHRQIRAHPDARQVAVHIPDRRMFMPGRTMAYINLPAVIALTTCSPVPVATHDVLDALGGKAERYSTQPQA